MTKLFILFFLLCSTALVHAQIINAYDTLTYHERINSNIDSVDVSGSDSPTTFDGGNSVLSQKGLSAGTLFNQYTHLNFTQLGEWPKMEFSALPHLGFSYSFGGQGSQFLRFKYNHAFTNNTVLDLRYRRNVGTGILRNGAFTTNDVKLQFQHKGSRYSVRLKGEYDSYDVAHSGGLKTDTLIVDYGLEYSPVNKGNAHSKSKIAQLSIMNFLNLLADSSNALGIVTNHHYSILNRVYTESSDTLNGIYDTLYIDTLSTRDQFNLATLTNGAGLYFSNSKLYIHGIVNYSYWNFQNLGMNHDTTEVDVTSYARLTLRKLEFTNSVRMNLVGRYHEFSERIQLNYRGRQLDAGAFLLYEKLAPTAYQRRYFSNASNSVMTSFQRQGWMRARAFVNYSFKNKRIKLFAFGDYSSISGAYYFDSTSWSNGTFISTDIFSTGIGSEMKFGVFNFHPKLVYSYDKSGYLPKFQAYGRIYVKGRLFKAKKLEAVAGVDASYISGFNTRTYLPFMDTYDWKAVPGTFTPMINLHAFVSFGIADFRFYLRYENIGYFWSDKLNQTVSNYPLAGPRFRIGITWDFFN